MNSSVWLTLWLLESCHSRITFLSWAVPLRSPEFYRFLISIAALPFFCLVFPYLLLHYDWSGEILQDSFISLSYPENSSWILFMKLFINKITCMYYLTLCSLLLLTQLFSPYPVAELPTSLWIRGSRTPILREKKHETRNVIVLFKRESAPIERKLWSHSPISEGILPFNSSTISYIFSLCWWEKLQDTQHLGPRELN